MVYISETTKALLVWVQSPDPNTLKDVLAAIKDADLILIAQTLTKSPAGRLAWAEFGRRVGYIDFEIKAVQLKGCVDVTFEGDAKPIHVGPILKVD